MCPDYQLMYNKRVTGFEKTTLPHIQYNITFTVSVLMIQYLHTKVL